MAEGLARHMLAELGLDVVVSSAGVNAPMGRPASTHGMEILLAKGIDIGSHRSRQLTGRILAEVDLVVALEEEHRLAIMDMPSAVFHEVLLLSEWAGEAHLGPGVDDPYGGSREEYEATAGEIETYIRRALART